MQALILAGGEGTRLRPLTFTLPKPVVPLVDRPFISYMLEWLRGQGVDDVILSCGFLANGVRAVLGDGESLGIRLRYIEEPEPLGTGGALKFAEGLLDDQFLMLNGDVLTDIDVTAALEQHRTTGARATLALVPVDDPSAYGLVRLAADSSVSEFLEKPSEEQIDTNLINAGAYVLERELLAVMPPSGTNFSIERDVFPSLVGHGLSGHRAEGYWLDIGTPARYLQGTFDILAGTVRTAIGAQIREAGGVLAEGARIDGVLCGPAFVGDGSRLAAGATAGPNVVFGRDVVVDEGAVIEHSVLLDGARVGAASEVRSAIIGPRARIGEHCQTDEDVVLGEGASVASGSTVPAGARIFPGVQVAEGAIER
jgi:mannose-1-phosphate guanylyltransferase